MAIHKKSQNRISKDRPQKLNEASKKPFKAKKKDSNNTSRAEAVALQLEDDVPDFPRGGGSSLSKREREEIHAEVDAEFDNGERFMKKKNKGKNRSNSAPDDLGSLFGDGMIGTLPRFANKITLKNVSPGMKLWGVVAEVNEKDLVISLPGGLRGLVRSTDAIDPVFGSELEDVEGKLQDIFHVGQLVSCTVQRLDDDKKDNAKKKIWLSLRLSLLHKGLSLDAVQEGMILTAYVKSIEDHGYILHFGLPSFMGFLPKKKEADSRDAEVRVGNVLQGIVRRIDKSHKVVYLDSDPDIVSKTVMKDLQGISIDFLVPGMMVNARVQSTLENGFLLSFLTYFTGTVDIFHLQNAFPASSWKDDYSKNKKVNARILFVDPSTRAIGLTLSQHLVHNIAPPMSVKAGDICENAEVVRVDRGMGLLLRIPSGPSPTPAYVSVADVAEEEIRKLEKKFKAGSSVRVRILSFKHLEGVAIGILKASAFDGPVFTHSDVKPGMVVRAKVIAVDTFGAIVQFPGGVKALCPLRHMSEFEIFKPRKKFKVGADLLFRVLGCKSKRITVTHKKTLVKSTLPILSSYTDATDGLLTHGWITKIEKHGCFVHFYNGVQGFAPRSELGLEPGNDAATMYQVGQVVKCRVISTIAASHRINLSFMMKPTRVSEQAIQLGSVVSGVVEKVTPSAVILYVNAEGYSKGIISTEHLADHHEHAVLMKSIVKVGHEFDQLIVLDIENNNLILSAKYSLINSAQQLPSDIGQVSSQLVVHGYICNLIETGCFVRFLGRLTGFSPRNKAMDDQRAQISEAFYVGQSVRSSILDVNTETNRITVSLKQSSCSSTDASFLQGYFLQDLKIAKLQSSDAEGPEFKWIEGFNIGNVIEGKVQELKEFGVVVSFHKYDCVIGFITHYQLGEATVEVGSCVQAVVLDASPREHIVDLSLKEEFLVKHEDVNSDSQSHKKKRKREANTSLQLHQTVNAIVEVVKENYLVLSIPEYNYTIGYASISDYNTQKLTHKQFLNGESVNATVVALPSTSTAERLLLLLKSINEVSTSSGSKKAKKKSSYNVGSIVQAEIIELKPLEMRVKFGIGFHGRIHITEVNDDCLNENPFGNFKIGQVVTARIVAKTGQSENKKGQLWDLSVKPKVLTESWYLENNFDKKIEYSLGQAVAGYVCKVDSEWVWLTISRKLKGQLYILDTACEPSELQEFQKRFYVGKPVIGYVLNGNKEKKLLRIVLQPLVAVSNGHSEGEILDAESKHSPQDLVTAHIREGDFLGGKISNVLPGVGGLIVQIGPHLHGRVHFTELQDAWVPDPLHGYHEAEFVKCKVLEVCQSAKGTIHIDLSLRKSQCDAQSQNSVEFTTNVNSSSERVGSIENLHPSMIVQGYVKNVTSKGCFISLSRKLDAKVLLSNLSDKYIDRPEEDFPIGKLVTGSVLSVEPLSKRVEVTLKTNSPAKSKVNDLSCLHVGELVSGMIKRVESYGLFIIIGHTNLVGLCHVSQLPEDRVDNIESRYRTGEKVSAKILKVDKERLRISLGMKSKDIEDNTDGIHSRENSVELTTGDDSSDDEDSQLILFPDNDLHGTIDMDNENENAALSALVQAESRASIPPLEVNLDEIEQLHQDIKSKENVSEAEKMDRKDKRRKRKRAKEEREQEIRAAEERLLEKGIPETADEFEKLVIGSPNSSFVWIKYMAFMLSLADVEKARSIAERALRTINMREENEKLNVWVAYFNLENKYGNPPEEAVKKVFQRALQYCDPEKLYLALLGMYERTEQHKLADELLDKMVKKFKDSCTVWLRRVQWLLNQERDGIHSVIQRALLSLPRYKHIEFISQAAILEFKSGVPERGRSLFEGVLREYPKRTDLWSVYLDQEIRLGDVDLIRSLFERAVSLSLPPKKMKFLFKKYLDYEKSIGDEERIDSVKQKAMEYVESTLA